MKIGWKKLEAATVSANQPAGPICARFRESATWAEYSPKSENIRSELR